MLANKLFLYRITIPKIQFKGEEVIDNELDQACYIATSVELYTDCLTGDVANAVQKISCSHKLCNIPEWPPYTT